ncbi:MAG: phospholipase A [Desulfobacterales bacterium]|nr:phospholipase A [Desulfobacterales bacterium]MCP4163375.1 phospholipase A [Deltaproteobacteria bacterium]
MKQFVKFLPIITALLFFTTGQLFAVNITEDSNEGMSRFFSAHKPNYILIYNSYHQADDKSFPSTEDEIKFQFSFKHNLMWLDFGNLYFGYTQKSFWQIYDDENSRPFRETNYNPEIFFRTAELSGLSLDIGVEHESNGGTVEYDSGGNAVDKSRSWNRAYLSPKYKYEISKSSFFQIELKMWDQIDENNKSSNTNELGDENSDIDSYYGSKELRLKLKLDDLIVSTMSRRNFTSKRGAFQLDVSYPIYTGLYLHLQFFEGYGESLIDYNNSKTTYGVGLMFTR